MSELNKTENKNYMRSEKEFKELLPDFVNKLEAIPKFDEAVIAFAKQHNFSNQDSIWLVTDKNPYCCAFFISDYVDNDEGIFVISGDNIACSIFTGKKSYFLHLLNTSRFSIYETLKFLTEYLLLDSIWDSFAQNFPYLIKDEK